MTTTYRVRGPDGQVHEFSGPDNATPDAVLAAAQAQFGSQQPQGSPADRARAAGQQHGSQFSSPLSGLYSAANSALFGGGDYVAAATRYLAQHGGAAQHPDDFSTDLAYSQGVSQGSRQQNPLSSIGGDIGGALAPGAGLAHGVETATRLAPKLALQAHEPIANLLRLIGSGAIAGGSYGAARGAVEGGEQNGAAGVLPGAGLGGAKGVVTGAAAAPLAAGAAKLVQKGAQASAPQAQKAIALLADKLGVHEDTIATAMNDYKASTGHAPTIADVADAVTKANVEPVVNARQSSAAKMQAAAQDKAAALPQQMSQGITQGGATKTPFNGSQVSTARVADLRNTQSGLMDVAMGPRGADGARHPAALGAQPVLPSDAAAQFLDNPQIVEARQNIPGLNAILQRGLLKSKPAVTGSTTQAAGGLQSETHPFDMSLSDIDSAIANKETQNQSDLVRAFGSQERAQLFKSLDRRRNSINPAVADAADKQFGKEFSNLTPEQERLAYGVGDNTPQVDDLKELRAAKEWEHEAPTMSDSELARLTTRGMLDVSPDVVKKIASGSGDIPFAHQVAALRVKIGLNELGKRGTSGRLGGLLYDSMAARGATPGDAAELLGDWQKLFAQRSAQSARPALNGPVMPQASADSGALTVDDIDSVRQSLSRLQQTVGATNSHFADDIGQIRDTLVSGAKQAQPAYGQALDAYTRQEQFIQGFQHAAQGKSIHDVPDMGDIRTFDTHEGRAGLELGARSRLAQTASETESGAVRTAQQLRQGAPSKTLESLPAGERTALQSRGAATAKSQQNYADLAANSLPSKAQETASGIQNAVEGTVATVGHTLTGFKAHAVTRLLTKAGTSEATANAIVDLLTRANTPADIANLRNALNRSVSDARIRRLVLKQVGRNAAVGTTSALQGAVQ